MTDKQPSEKAMAEAEWLLTKGAGGVGVRLMIVGPNGENFGGWGPHALAQRFERFAEAARREENDLAIEALERLLRRAANGDISSGDVRAEQKAIAARRRP